MKENEIEKAEQVPEDATTRMKAQAQGWRQEKMRNNEKLNQVRE